MAATTKKKRGPIYDFRRTPAGKKAMNKIARKGDRGLDPSLVDGRVLRGLFHNKLIKTKRVKDEKTGKRVIHLFLTPKGEIARKI